MRAGASTPCPCFSADCSVVASRQGWTGSGTAFAFLAFNAALFVITFGLLYAQQYLPLNPDGKGSLGALGYKDTAGTDHPGADTGVVFNTVCSFVTNTNLQHYSGEQHLSYFSQLGGIVWLQFVTPAAGLAVMLAIIRGLRGDKHMGDFYLDLMRILCFVFIPLCLILALLLVACGMPMTFDGAVKATPLDGAAAKMDTQTIARGPVAALVAVKQIGTNGGGYFGPNSTHPFENPSPWSNLIEIVEITLLPMASLVMLGLMLKNRAHAAVIYGAMLAFLVAGVAIAVYFEVAAQRRDREFARRPGPQHGGKGGPHWRHLRRDLGGDDDGHLQWFGQQHARQPQSHRRHGPDCRT